MADDNCSDVFDYFEDKVQSGAAVTDASYMDKRKDWNEISARNQIYTQFLFTYIANSNQKSKHQVRMKIWFFAIIMSLLAILVIAACVALVNISAKALPRVEDVVTVITAISGVITSFIVIPKVIAKNLFPPSEDDKTAQIFGSMIKSDLKLRKYYAPMDSNEEKIKEASIPK